jgi:hypothetical protein
MVVLSPDDAFRLDRERFRTEALAEFGSSTVVTEQDTVQIDRPTEPFFQIFYLGEEAISTDGTPEQAIEVALWVRSLLPDDPGGRIWMVDQGYSGHVELVPGMTAGDVKTGWIEHDTSVPE